MHILKINVPSVDNVMATLKLIQHCKSNTSNKIFYKVIVILLLVILGPEVE